MSQHHAELGVSTNATPEQIDQAYRRMSRKYHPDRPGGSTEKMQRINAAYEALKNPQSAANKGQQFKPGSRMGYGHFKNDGCSECNICGEHSYDGEEELEHLFTNHAFDPNNAPDDNLGGYSYNQHMNEMFAESRGDEEAERKRLQKNQALAQGWTKERVEHMNCAWCGDSMEGTEPHEILNKLEPQTPTEKLVFSHRHKFSKIGNTDKLVGMHDECYEDAKPVINFNSYCEMCDQPLNNHNNKECMRKLREDIGF